MHSIILSNCIALQFIISFVIILRILNKNEQHEARKRARTGARERKRVPESGHTREQREQSEQRYRRRLRCCFDVGVAARSSFEQRKVKISFRCEHSTCADVSLPFTLSIANSQ